MGATTAQQVRDSADRSAIQLMLDSFPWGADVEPRPAGSLTDRSVGIDQLPKDPGKRLAKLLASERYYRESLVASIEKHDLLKRNGVDAMSDVDLVMAFSGSLNACRNTMELHEAHISYYLSALEILEQHISAMDDSVPPGYQCVDVILPAFQAYEVRLWAAAAQPKVAEARLKARLNAIGKSETAK
jgi:hypothetical protein